MIKEGFQIISRDGQIGIYFSPTGRHTTIFQREEIITSLQEPPGFFWDLRGIGVLMENEFETISMLYPEYFNEPALKKAYAIARRDGLAVVNVEHDPDEDWR